MSDKFGLEINHGSIDAHPFIQHFIEHTVSGMLKALKGTEKIKDLDLAIKGESITINLNGTLIPINAMTGRLIKNTIFGLVSTLQPAEDIIELNIFLHEKSL